MELRAAKRRTWWPALVATAAALLGTAAEASLARNSGRSELLAPRALAASLENQLGANKPRVLTQDLLDQLGSSEGLEQRRPFSLDLDATLAGELVESLQNSLGANKPRVSPRPFGLFARPSRPAAGAGGQDLASALEAVGSEKLASGPKPWEPRLNVWQIQHFASISRWGAVAYARARWYDSRNATWLSEDPLGDVDSPNLYAFCSHNPHMRRDPLGLAGYVAGPDGMREQSASEFYQMLLRLGYKVEEAQRIAIEAGYGPEMGARGAQAAVRGGALASGVFVPMSHATAYAAQVPAAPLALAGPPGTALMGAWYGFTQKLTENALYNRPSLMQGVGSSTATGGAWGLALGALGKAGGAVARTPLAKRLIYRVAYSRVGYPILQATRRLLERETMPSILPMGRGPATAGHHTIPVYTGAREDQELVDLFVDTHFGTHEFLDNWSLPPGMSPRSPAPLSYRGEIRPWGRENPYLEIFAAESATNRRYIVDNLRRAYKEYGIYNELSEVFERESAIFIKGGE